MKIVVAGGSGFIGKPLVERLIGRGHDLLVLTRDPSKVRAGRGLQWDGRTQGKWSGDAATADVIINLAGENIGTRWTEERKRRIVDSRIQSTRALVEASKSRADRERAFLSASAVGYYGPRGDEQLDEDSPRGAGFLADVTAAWEGEARAADAVARLAILRFGVVFAGDGGALARMATPFRFGLGGRVGSGRQWVSWVDREDLIQFVEWVIDQQSARGVYNLTSPQPVRNAELAAAIGRALHRPAVFPAPAFALRLVFGQMADEALLSGQRVVPAHATREGFSFTWRDIDSCLAHAFRH